MKFSHGQDVDAREYGLTAKDETLAAYEKLQTLSKTRHKDINRAVMKLVEAANGGFSKVRYEQVAGATKGLCVDVMANRNGDEYFIEFHHKANSERITTPLQFMFSRN